MKKIISIGDALIDFIPSQKGCELKNVPSFTRVAGGACANVCAVIAKLGGKSSFISKLGKDAFGDYIIDVLDNSGVDINHILRTSEANTGLAFVSLKEDGDRDFSFYRNPSADLLLNENELCPQWFNDGYALHFCSVDLVESPMKYAHVKAIEYAKQHGLVISFDPNVRLPLWESAEKCKNTIIEFLSYADILKISDDELEFITGHVDIDNAKQFLFDKGIKLIIFTKGKDGSEAHTKEFNAAVKCRPTKAVDTTGAGDSFIGSFLYSLCKDDASIDNLAPEKLKKYLNFSAIYAEHSIQGKGAIESYATLEQINEYIENTRATI